MSTARATPGTTTGTATAADGTRLAHQVSGLAPGAGPVLLLLPGQGNDHTWFDPVRAGLEAGRTLVTLDPRGTGGSGEPGEGTTTALLADDAVAVLDALGVERADVCGTSMGGRVAQELALRHPGRVRRLVLGCTSPGGAHALERDAEVRRGLARGGPEARAFLLDLMYTPGWLAAHPGPHPVTGDPTATRHARREHLRASDGHDAWDRLPGLRAPTLLLTGTDDRLTPPVNSTAMAARVPGAHLVTFEDARHAYFHERADEATPVVLDFLA